MFLGRPNVTLLNQLSAKNRRKEVDPRTALVILEHSNVKFSCSSILITLRSILCTVVFIESFIPYNNGHPKMIDARIGAGTVSETGIIHSVADIQVQGKVIRASHYPSADMLAVLTVVSKQNCHFTFILFYVSGSNIFGQANDSTLYNKGVKLII